MPRQSSIFGIKDNHSRGSVGDFLAAKIQEGSRFSIASAYFTSTRTTLSKTGWKIAGLQFLFGEPSPRQSSRS